MVNRKRVPLRTFFTMFFVFELILLATLGLVVFFLFQNQSKLAESRDAHYNSYLLADELRQSSDDLTRMVRAYVATGDSRFESEYWKVLDIRNGTAPRPQDYHRIYWDFYDAESSPPRADGRAESLVSLMEKAGFTDEEFALLSLSQKHSDDLVKTEEIAMKAMKGVFRDEAGNFTVSGEPDRALAQRLVNDDSYYQMKASIMRPIDDFYQKFENRTAGSVAKYLQNVSFWFRGLSIVIFLIFIVLSIFFALTWSQATKLELAGEELVQQASDLEKLVEERTKKLRQSEVKTKKALEQAETMNSLLVGREIKMIELKKELEKLSGKNDIPTNS